MLVRDTELSPRHSITLGNEVNIQLLSGLFPLVAMAYLVVRPSPSLLRGLLFLTIRFFQFMCLNVPVPQVRKYPERPSTFRLHRYYLLLSLCQNNSTFTCSSTFHCSRGGSIFWRTKMSEVADSKLFWHHIRNVDRYDILWNSIYSICHYSCNCQE